MDKIFGKYRALKSLIRIFLQFENWPEVWRQYRQGQHLPPLKVRKGPTIHHRIEDDPLHLYREIFTENCYTKDFYQPQAGDVIIDCGANIGLFALYIQSIAPGAFVHCFEPAESTRKILEKNIAENNFGDFVKVYPYGVFNQRSTIELLKSDLSGHRSFVESQFVAKASEAETEKIECISLAEAMEMAGARRVDFLKVDVEGAEIEILEGASSETLDKIERVALEYHNIIRQGAKDRVVRVLKGSQFSSIVSYPDHPDDRLGVLHAKRIS